MGTLGWSKSVLTHWRNQKIKRLCGPAVTTEKGCSGAHAALRFKCRRPTGDCCQTRRVPKAGDARAPDVIGRKLKCPWVSHLQIQPTEDRKEYFPSTVGNPRRQRANCSSVIERELTCPMDSFKVCNSVVFNIFRVVQPSPVYFRTFRHPQKMPHTH